MAGPSGFVDGPNLFAYVGNNTITMIDPTGLFGMSFGNGVGCPYAVGSLLARELSGESNDKYKHCAISCAMTAVCGPLGSAVLGIGKELKDLTDKGDADWKDLFADARGILCGLRAKSWNDCKSDCRRLYP